MQRIPITLEGERKLRQELEYLKNTARPMVIKAIAEARSHGDLKENAEYHAAREQQSFIEGRIAEIESILSRAQVIDVRKIAKTGRIIFGVSVTLMRLDENKKCDYQLVGEDEADLSVNKISITSPLARAMIGKKEGEVIDVHAPQGVVSYQILAVEHK